MDREDEYIRLARAVAEGVPVRTDARELEADRRAGVCGGGGGELEVFGQETRFRQSFLFDDAGVDPWRFAAGVAYYVLFPGDAVSAVSTVELGFVGWEMAESEIIVRHRKKAGREGFIVRFTMPANVASAPAAVDKLPLAIVDLHRVPGVAL